MNTSKMCEHSNGWRPEDGVPDLAMMSDITDQGINTNLRTRYKRDQIYTFSGSILIAVNPYKQLDIYNTDWVARYREQKLDRTDPHVFALAESMYMSLVMQEPRKNQACVISGESGAGKTETTKFILSYLCSVTPNKSTWMEHQILEANTILEAFGNAKTVRNDNSSRFGKFIQICFDTRHQINGCIIQDYLLEQSRITYQSVDERNYHVFYQLLAAGQANQELRMKFHLMPANFYDYLNKTNSYTIEGIDDCAMFNSLRTAMAVLNIEQDKLFSVVSAILWLGNLQFECDEGSQNESCHLTQNDIKIADIVAELLGVERQKLEHTLLRRQINVRGSITEIPFRLHEARDNRNGMAKALYSRLFTWVVNFINASTNPGSENTCFMGVLDIFGFENFETNSFEQLCINYANEKLHKFFNHHMFAMEQELYQREGIEFCDINYTDNTACLELLERPPSCILRLLSEECRMPKGSDLTFVEKLHSEFATVNPHPFYIKGSDRRNWSSEFSVRHFAGSVAYNVDGFLKKNRDAQQTQLLDLLENSGTFFLRNLIEGSATNQQQANEKPSGARAFVRHESIDLKSLSESARARLNGQRSLYAENLSNQVRRESSFGPASSTLFTNNSSKTRPTVADAFRQQLVSLVDVLNSVNPWYIRCIKPNLDKSATEYDDRQVLTQLKYLGMSDLIKIRREGYPIHLTKHQFVCRYRCLMLSEERINPKGSPIKLDTELLEKYCMRIMNHFALDPKDWKIGKTMVLLRTSVYQPMEERRKFLFIKMATLIQSTWRGFVQRRKYNRWRRAALRVQETFRAYRGRLLFLRTKRAALTIQAYVRGMFAREIAGALREIKRVEAEKARKAAIEQERATRELEMRERSLQQAVQEQQEQPIKESIESENDIAIVVTEAANASDVGDIAHANRLASAEGRSPDHGAVPEITKSSIETSNEGRSDMAPTKRDATDGQNGSISMRDRREMEELVKVMEKHGISLASLEKNGDCVYTDFEKLYDVLGSNQLHVNGEALSVSPSVNEDDRCSMITTGTGCDGDSVSCSGQSQISSTITDEHQCTTTNEDENQTSCEQSNTNMSGEDTVNQNQPDGALRQHHSMENANYHSNSIESIASIMSTSSTHSASVQAPALSASQIAAPQSSAYQIAPAAPTAMVPTQDADSAVARHSTSADPGQIRTSTFTGSLVVAGSKLASNGRPLTRIEEEPNSTATSPSKTPYKERSTGPQSLFPPECAHPAGNQIVADPAKLETFAENKKRRLERKILQVQQQEQQLIQPTTSGLLAPLKQGSTATNNSSYRATDPHDRMLETSLVKENHDSGNEDSIYGAHKNSMIEYAETAFNNHPRDSSSGGASSGSSGEGGVIRTLTRRRKSIDSTASEYLSKAEMLSYNSSHVIPTSHIRMHDPHNVQISCTLFRNLCKYMTGENLKPETETRIIQSIVRHGIEKTELRDEIYVQVIRQLTNNSNSDYCSRLWILLGLITAAFSPSKTFSKYLVNYLKSKPRKDLSITCHVQFCLDNLQAPRISARKYPPSPLEIQACKNLSNLICKIYLLDGRCISIGVHPCDTAIDSLTKLADRIKLQSIEGWVLYESYTGGSSKYPHPAFEEGGDFERSVKSHSYMADILALWQDAIPNKPGAGVALKLAQKRLDEGGFRLTLKKRIFRGPKIRNDPVEISLLYSQAVYNVVRRDSFLVDESLAISLAGLQAQVTLGNAEDMIKTGQQDRKGKQIKVTKSSNKQPNINYDIESYICQRVRHQTNRTKKEWSALIQHSHEQFRGEKQNTSNHELFCKMRYLSMVISHCPLYGTTTFNVTYKGYQTLDQNLMLGVNSEGLVIIRASDRALINAYRYSDMANENGVLVYADEKLIQFSIIDRADGSIKCMAFETDENEEIAMLMMSYSPTLRVNIRGSSIDAANRCNFNIDQSAIKKKPRLKMTLEDRLRTHQEVQNARRAIIRSGRLRKMAVEESAGLFKHTLKRLSSNNKFKDKPNRFDYIYGTLTKAGNQKSGPSIPQTSSDYNIYGSNRQQPSDGQFVMNNNGCDDNEVAGVTASKVVDELTKAYPHRYWAYTNSPLKCSLLTIYDPDLEEAALSNFRAILTYSGLLNYIVQDSGTGSANSTLDSSSIDSGIASQQSLGNFYSKNTNGSPSSISSNDLYDVCPKKVEQRDLIRLAQSILDRCLKKDADILKNEFFLQLIKQTTDHPDPNNEINRRHWQLLALACSITYPSDGKILAYLFAHLKRCSLDQVTDEGDFARFTLKSLQGTLDTKGRRYAPSETEIISTISCRRVYARVYFLDGQFQAVEFDPCATIAEVVDQIKQKIGLKPESMGYALFQPLDDDCEQVLQPEEKVGDAIASWEIWHKQKQIKIEPQAPSQQRYVQNSNLINKTSLTQNITSKTRAHKFIFKKYLFIDSSTDLKDPVERELLYYQTVASIKEDKFPIFEHEASILCALKAQIEIGDYSKLTNLPKEHIRMIYKQVIISLMPPHAFNNLPIPAIEQHHQAFGKLSCTDTKKYFFNLIQSFGRAAVTNDLGHILLHQAHIYDATQTSSTAWPSDIWIVVNQVGLHVLVAKERVSI